MEIEMIYKSMIYAIAAKARTAVKYEATKLYQRVMGSNPIALTNVINYLDRCPDNIDFPHDEFNGSRGEVSLSPRLRQPRLCVVIWPEASPEEHRGFRASAKRSASVVLNVAPANVAVEDERLVMGVEPKVSQK